MSELKHLDPNTHIEVPAEVAICPYCGTALTIIDVMACEDDGKGAWQATELLMVCASQPPASDRKAASAWDREHSYMRYVYWLPAYMRVLGWVGQRYRFGYAEAQREAQP